MTTDTIAIRTKRSAKIAFDTAAGLHLAAAPTLAVMALVSGVFGGGTMDGMCGMPGSRSPVDRMASMYLLMAVFHLAPWLKLVARQRAKR